jgi:hypothetical protein
LNSIPTEGEIFIKVSNLLSSIEKMSVYSSNSDSCHD